jgi:hypothetical protein
MSLRQEQKDYIRRSLPRFLKSIIAIALAIFLLIIMIIVNVSIKHQIDANTATISELKAKINIAEANYVQEDIYTNIDNVHYDTKRCKDDDAKIFATLKPMLAYDNADSYNVDRQAIVKDTDSTALSTLFPKINYSEANEYGKESDYRGKVADMYTSDPKNFKSYLINISGDVYTYTSVITVELSDRTRGKHTDCIVLTYSTKASGEVDYSTMDGMRCTDVR